MNIAACKGMGMAITIVATAVIAIIRPVNINLFVLFCSAIIITLYLQNLLVVL